MIDPSMDTLVISPPSPQVSLEEKVAELESRNKDLEDSFSYYRKLVAGYEYKIENLRDYLIDNIHIDISGGTANDIADIMEIELVKDRYFDVTVRFFGSIQVGPDDDVEELISSMDFDMTDNSRGNLYFGIVDTEIQSIKIDS